MLKFVLLFLFTFGAWANEPEKVLISKNGKLIEIEFSKLTRVKMKAINYHPNFVSEGEALYEGYLIKDIVKGIKVKSDQNIVLVGKTGQFSLELNEKEFLGEDVIIATHKNGIRFTDKNNGNQIIYGPKTIAKFPHLKTRQYWCWWVRSFILDNEDQRSMPRLPSEKKILSSVFPFPAPYGISSRGAYVPQTRREGNILQTDKAKAIRLHQLNGNGRELPIKEGVTYFLSKSKNLKEGGLSLYALEVSGNKVTNFLSNNYYLEKVEIIK